MEKLNYITLALILNKLDNASRINALLAMTRSSKIKLDDLRKFISEIVLQINENNLHYILENEEFNKISFKNASLNLKNSSLAVKMFKCLERFDSIELLELKYLNFKDSNDKLKATISHLHNLNSLKLNGCYSSKSCCESLPPISKIKILSFENCDKNVYKLFKNQNSLQIILVNNDDHKNNLFCHNMFHEICKNNKILNHIVLKGAEIGRFFDMAEFPFKLKNLETSETSSFWSIGKEKSFIRFLESQKGSLKELTIHELPYDFDGGNVLKYIIEEMNLETFYYGKIPLILNGQKQEVNEFQASEIQITSIYEMIRQFPSIEKLTLKLCNTQVSTNDIENIINFQTKLFNNIKEFEVIDSSGRLFGIFLGLYLNLRNLEKLTLTTQDRNINTILKCFPVLLNLKRLEIKSTVINALERYQIIRNIAPNLKNIQVPSESIDEAKRIFNSTNVKVITNE